MTSSFCPTGSVLVAIDGSTGSDTALAWAAVYAEAKDRPLAIVHIGDLPVVTDFAIDIPAARDDLLQSGHRVTDRALERVTASHPALPAEAYVTLGEPRALLTEMAGEASVLVLGSRGRGALASLLLGSVSVALAARAPCPVVVARPLPRDVAPGDLSVVVGVDGGEDAADALVLAFELASAQFRPLEVVYAIGDPWLSPYPDMVTPDLVTASLDASGLLLDELLEGYGAKFPDVVVRRRVMQETPTQALVDASATASVVVVGCRGRGGARSLVLGSVSRSVVERAHSTVVVSRGVRT